MNRRRTAGGILDAKFIVVVAAVNEVVELPLRSAVLETGAEGVVTAAVHANFAARLEDAALGLNIHDARRAEAVLRGQRAGDKLHALDKARVQFQPKPGNAFGQQDVVDAILQIGVLAADVQIAILRRILRHARRAQDQLIERRVGSLWFRGDLGFADRVSRRAEVGQNLAARLVEMAHDRDRVQFCHVGGGWGGSRGIISLTQRRRIAGQRSERNAHATDGRTGKEY